MQPVQPAQALHKRKRYDEEEEDEEEEDDEGSGSSLSSDSTRGGQVCTRHDGEKEKMTHTVTRSPIHPNTTTRPSMQGFQKPRIVGPSSVSKSRVPLVALTNDTPIQANPLGTLKKPFKVPIPGYIGESAKGALGVKKARPRGPLHDPEVPGAVVLYRAPPLSPQDAINPEIK